MAYDEAYEDLLDSYARELYRARSQSTQEMTDERWARIKTMFGASVRICRSDALRFHGAEIRALAREAAKDKRVSP